MGVGDAAAWNKLMRMEYKMGQQANGDRSVHNTTERHKREKRVCSEAVEKNSSEGRRRDTLKG